MKLVFGLGNPGDEYKGTRHNVGFEIIDRFSASGGLPMKLGGNYLYSENENCLFVKPLLFVNESGLAAKEVISKFNIELSDFLVVLDDFSIPLGVTRMRLKGSDGGHKGLRSIIYQLESEDFPRLRIGIGPTESDAVDFVLSRFKKEEIKILGGAIDKAVLSIEAFIKEGIDKAMEICNTN